MRLPPPDPDFLESDKGWPALRAGLALLIDFHGDPRDLALAAPLEGRLRRALSFALRMLEELVRRLLLIEAELMAPLIAVPEAAYGAPYRPRTGPLPPRKRWSENPASWSCAPPLATPLAFAKDARGDAHAMPKTLRFTGNRTLAYRLEALRRVADNPALYARRLAARIRACRIMPERLVFWPLKALKHEGYRIEAAQIQAYRVWTALRRRMTGKDDDSS